MFLISNCVSLGLIVVSDTFSLWKRSNKQNVDKRNIYICIAVIVLRSFSFRFKRILLHSMISYLCLITLQVEHLMCKCN
jgi:hypothetical protein